jgi:hypothetical protein
MHLLVKNLGGHETDCPLLVDGADYELDALFEVLRLDRLASCVTAGVLKELAGMSFLGVAHPRGPDLQREDRHPFPLGSLFGLFAGN